MKAPWGFSVRGSPKPSKEVGLLKHIPTILILTGRGDTFPVQHFTCWDITKLSVNIIQYPEHLEKLCFLNVPDQSSIWNLVDKVTKNSAKFVTKVNIQSCASYWILNSPEPRLLGLNHTYSVLIMPNQPWSHASLIQFHQTIEQNS